MSSREGQVALEPAAVPDLAARIAAGDRAAETEFVERYGRGVRALVRRHCRPGDPVADDIAQEALARIIERLRAGAVRDAAALPAYVRATSVHLCSAEYRARRPQEPVQAIERLESGDNPADRCASHELAALLRAVLQELPVARDRELLARFYLDEQDKDVVCRQLGIDAAHFHRVVFRARERLRQLLDRAGIGRNG
jgi:RNA polymerase sigma-70 factor (ECF subfamily)